MFVGSTLRSKSGPTTALPSWQWLTRRTVPVGNSNPLNDGVLVLMGIWTPHLRTPRRQLRGSLRSILS